MHRDEINERAAGIFVPDTLLASQYFDRVRGRKDLTGEQRLMCALIEDGVGMYLKHAGAARGHHRVLFDEAERWIESEDTSWVHSFGTICDYLGLDSAYLRRGLRAWKARARGAEALPDSAVASPSAPIDQRLAG